MCDRPRERIVCSGGGLLILESSSLLISETKVRRRPGVMPDLVGVDLGLAVLTKPPVAEGMSSARGRRTSTRRDRQAGGQTLEVLVVSAQQRTKHKFTTSLKPFVDLTKIFNHYSLFSLLTEHRQFIEPPLLLLLFAIVCSC